jgi:hypothetical protein
MEASWQVFQLMECFRDEYRGWRFMPSHFGIPMAGWLMEDLLTWKRLAGIVETTIEKARKDKK